MLPVSSPRLRGRGGEGKGKGEGVEEGEGEVEGGWKGEAGKENQDGEWRN